MIPGGDPYKVVYSCQTMEQLETARNWCSLWLKRGGHSGVLVTLFILDRAQQIAMKKPITLKLCKDGDE